MKKAFTLSEALVTLAIIGVLAAILIPVINNARPDKDKITYKKALYSLQNAVANAMDEASAGVFTPSSHWGPGLSTSKGWTGGWGGSNYGSQISGSITSGTATEGKSFCDAVADSLNISGSANCGSSSYTTPNFVTTDGIRFWGLENDSTFDTGNHEKVIKVDRKLSTTERASTFRLRNTSEEGLRINVNRDGKVYTPADYSYENSMIQDSMSVVQKRPE